MIGHDEMGDGGGAMVVANANDQFSAAMAMLDGTGLSPRWREAVELIEAAASKGHAGALERRALIDFRGFGRASNQALALDTLADAAEQGSRQAAQQLMLLADDVYDPEWQHSAGAGNWAAVRSRVDVVRLTRPPATAGTMLSRSPIVHIIPGFVSPAVCRWLTDAAAPRLDRAVVYNTPGGVDPGRTNRSAPFNFAHSDIIVEIVRQRIASQLGAPLGCLELSQVLHYAVGQEFVLHCDFLDPHVLKDEIARNGQRVATFLIYLNDDFEGGETSFPKLGLNYRGKPGDALLFANVAPGDVPDPRSQHAGCPPTAGEKWIFSQWVRSKVPG